MNRLLGTNYVCRYLFKSWKEVLNEEGPEGVESSIM